jgi:cytoskeleton protein RodZ
MTDAVAATGPRLKAERERRGLSSQKAADELHLDGWVIDALEAENYERVGPSVYAKGHLKRYAALLGLPVAEIMAGYESRSLAPKTPAAPQASVRLRTDAPVSNLPWTQIVGGGALLILVLGVLWWKPWHQRGEAPVNGGRMAANSSAPAADTAAQSTEAAAPGSPTPATAMFTSAPVLPTSSRAVALSQSSPPAAPLPAASAQPPLPAPEEPAGSGRARLRLSFSADSWVDVRDADGRRMFAGNGRANTMRTIAGIAPMRVYLGIASGVQLEINNRVVAIGPQFVFGDVARFEAGADGVLRRDSRSAAAGTVAPGAVAPGTAAPGAAAAPGPAAPAATAPAAQLRNAHPTG